MIVDFNSFALVHLESVGVVFVAGLAFTWVYERRGSLWPAVLGHVTMNLVAMGGRYLWMVGG